VMKPLGVLQTGDPWTSYGRVGLRLWGVKK
jgi:hypothetical protein